MPVKSKTEKIEIDRYPQYVALSKRAGPTQQAPIFRSQPRKARMLRWSFAWRLKSERYA